MYRSPTTTISPLRPFSARDQLLNPHNTRRRRRRQTRRRRRQHISNPRRRRPNGPDNDDPMQVVAQGPVESPSARAPGRGEEVQDPLERRRELAVGAEVRVRAGGDEGDVVGGEGPGGLGDGAVARGGDVVGDGGLRGGEAG